MEKFFNIKCRKSGLTPTCAVIVATVRALKMHGGGPDVVAGKPLDAVYKQENLDLLRKGCANLIHHIHNVAKFQVKCVVAINRFTTDTEGELQCVRELCLEAGAFSAVVANHWAEGMSSDVQVWSEWFIIVLMVCRRSGGQGTRGGSDSRVCCRQRGWRQLQVRLFCIYAMYTPHTLIPTLTSCRYLYPLESTSIKEKISTISSEIYGAAEVTYSPLAEERIASYTSAGYSHFPICMAKTQYSLSTDAAAKGAPKGFTIHVRDIRVCVGAGYM